MMEAAAIEARRLVDINLIDAGGIHGGDGPGDGMLANQEREFFAALGGKQFGITQPADAVCRFVVLIEDDRGRYDWAEQGSATDFIDSSNKLRAYTPSPLFELKRAAEFFQQAQLGGGGGNSVRFQLFRCGDGLGHKS